MTQMNTSATLAARKRRTVPTVPQEAINDFSSRFKARSIIADGQPYDVIYGPFYHVQQYAQTGHTTLRFFNVAPSRFVSNLPTGGGATLQANHNLIINAVRVCFKGGITLAGAAEAPTEEITPVAAAAAQAANLPRALTTLSEKNRILAAGALTLEIGQRKVLDNVRDLTNFPYGAGLSANGVLAFDNFNTAAAGQTSAYNGAGFGEMNGIPSRNNVYRFNEPIHVPPLVNFNLTLDWQTAITFGASGNGGVIGVYLDGAIYIPKDAS